MGVCSMCVWVHVFWKYGDMCSGSTYIQELDKRCVHRLVFLTDVCVYHVFIYTHAYTPLTALHRLVLDTYVCAHGLPVK